MRFCFTDHGVRVRSRIEEFNRRAEISSQLEQYGVPERLRNQCNRPVSNETLIETTLLSPRSFRSCTNRFFLVSAKILREGNCILLTTFCQTRNYRRVPWPQPYWLCFGTSFAGGTQSLGSTCITWNDVMVSIGSWTQLVLFIQKDSCGTDDHVDQHSRQIFDDNRVAYVGHYAIQRTRPL